MAPVGSSAVTRGAALLWLCQREQVAVNSSLLWLLLLHGVYTRYCIVRLRPLSSSQTSSQTSTNRNVETLAELS